MRKRNFLIVAMMILAAISLFPEKAQASSVGFFLGFSSYHPYHYYHYRYYPRYHYYRPYPYYYGWWYYQPYYYSPYYYGPYGYYSYRGYGSVRAEVKPQNTRVYVDGDYVGVADDFDGWWQRLDLEPGRHRIVFRAPGYAPYAVTMRILPGRDYHIKQQMQPGEDQIAEQDMRLERKYEQEDSPRNERPRDYPDWESERRRSREPEPRSEPEAQAEPERDQRPTLTLEVEPSDATVYIDGNYYGTADLNGQGEIQVLLPQGVHRIEVVRPGYESFSQDVNVVQGQQNRLTITLKKR